jgi:hypothetical protein
MRSGRAAWVPSSWATHRSRSSGPSAIGSTTSTTWMRPSSSSSRGREEPHGEERLHLAEDTAASSRPQRPRARPASAGHLLVYGPSQSQAEPGRRTASVRLPRRSNAKRQQASSSRRRRARARWTRERAPLAERPRSRVPPPARVPRAPRRAGSRRCTSRPAAAARDRPGSGLRTRRSKPGSGRGPTRGTGSEP